MYMFTYNFKILYSHLDVDDDDGGDVDNGDVHIFLWGTTSSS